MSGSSKFIAALGLFKTALFITINIPQYCYKLEVLMNLLFKTSVLFLKHQFWYRKIGGSQSNIRILCTECLLEPDQRQLIPTQKGSEEISWMMLLLKDGLVLWYLSMNATCKTKAVRVLVVCPLLGLISSVQWQDFQLLLQLTTATKWGSKLAISTERLLSSNQLEVGHIWLTNRVN